MELLCLVIGIVLLWKFSGALNSLSNSAKSKAEVFSEDVIANTVQERTDRYEQFQTDMKGRTIYSHEEIMKSFKVD